MRIEHQPAYVLHLKPYRDTSAIIDLLTPDYGRIAVVARGVRKNKNTKRQLLNPFHRLLISFQGEGELKLLTHFESSSGFYPLKANYLYSGLYLNELLMRLLPELDAHNDFFSLYESSVHLLHQEDEIEPTLRNFEFRLMLELGYAIDFNEDAIYHKAIKEEASYICDPDRGFIELTALDTNQELVFPGLDILSIARQDYTQQSTRRSAKKITRLLLKPLLGKRPLKSRELFLS